MSWLKKFPSLLQLFGLRKKAGKENVTQFSPAADSPSPAASTPPVQESSTRHTEVGAAGNNDECQQSSVKVDSDQPTQVKETSKTTKKRTFNRKTPAKLQPFRQGSLSGERALTPTRPSNQNPANTFKKSLRMRNLSLAHPAIATSTHSQRTSTKASTLDSMTIVRPKSS